ncbi:Dyp-type peroxidase [Rothia aerolata]|uniref:Peroxidase n=1 Tax=Rothia aerolata TaxID=1812262 RepID=A0A917IUR3_9MICC|nr:Dyp-type peroxidase [Rothia aerolata]GGH62360.1 peroxidase [Rothia aerolata]
MKHDSQHPDSHTSDGINRRTLVAGAAGTGLGVAATLGAQFATEVRAQERAEEALPPLQTARVGFFGRRQAGVDTPPPAHASFIACDLNEELKAADIERLLRIITADAAQLTAGRAPVVDQEPELATIPAELTVTVGFGEKIFDLVNPAKKPGWLKPLTAFPQIDQLQEQWSHGDLLLQICSQDPLTLAHAQRMLLKDVRSFVTVRWVQSGFRNAYGSSQQGTTQRNLFGQVDGTINPTSQDETMDQFVWGSHEDLEPWEEGGTSLVIRRIHMNLDTWDQADRPAREDAVGRTLDTGAPLTGESEDDVADLSATTELGFPVIAPYAHIRRATAQNPVEHILRRPYNYDLPVSNASGFSDHGQTSGGVSNSGLIFCSYQADPLKQFVPVQKRLAELDMLNTWTVPIGSAVFALPAGCSESGFIGESLFS